MIIESSSQTRDTPLNILPTNLEVFLRQFSSCYRKVFHDEGYGKINKLPNCKCNLVSRFNKLVDTATKLGPKDTFLRTWNSITNNNESLNIQFNYFFPL